MTAGHVQRRHDFPHGRLSVALLCVCLWLAPRAGRSQEDGPVYQGFERCAFCHGRTLDEAVRPFRRDLCLLNEGHVWQQQDKHAQAFEVLRGSLSQQIGERLGWNVTSDVRCLSCHANQRPDVPPAADFEQQHLSEGVGCEACHGPGSKYDQPHSQPAWRGLPPAEKAALGMVDVRNPLTRARQCFSCHIGQVAQGKVITHEMYAAGHPPLAGIELESFALQMPRHWRYLPEKGALQNEAGFLAANYAGRLQPRSELPQTREVIVGGVVALIESLRLTADLADGAASVTWPELARYDCQACHHELRVPSWRQQRTAAGVPGRPLAPAWPAALVAPALHVLGEADAATDARESFEQHMQQVDQAFTVRPFGDSTAVVTSARRAAEWLEQELLPDLEIARFDRSAARRVLDQILLEAQSGTHDYDSARQLAWAAQVISAELFTPYPPEFAAPTADATDDSQLAIWKAWNTDVSARNRTDLLTVFDETGLQSSLSLRLPAGQTAARMEGAPPASPLAEPTRLQQHLPEWLQSASRYHPDDFKSQMNALDQALERLLTDASRNERE
jgi:hypothetical protein